MNKVLPALYLLLLSSSIFSQGLLNNKHKYTEQDTLRGSITDERAWWDLQQYELTLSIDPETQIIQGTNIIRYKTLSESERMQIDLQAPLKIDRVTQDGKSLTFESKGSAHFIDLQKNQIVGELNELIIEYSGKPLVAKRAPWDGGFSWSKDANGNHFAATSCQGIGASIWWPCKDHMYDEPDKGMIIHANVPENLVAVANGRLQRTTREKDGTKTYSWKVINPINNYGVNINVGDYVNFSEKYAGEKGSLDMDYWVLSYNLEKAKTHFTDAIRTMQALEHWFGPYPFYEDSYKLVEVPYLGMEHQSSVTYGNGYANGFNGRDRTEMGWGATFDYIIIHETAHEWFANNITYKDMADMWIHESFACYAEALFVEYFNGKKAGGEYVISSRMRIRNTSPMIADYDVNASPRGDIYAKGSNMLHTLRQIVDNDEKWRAMLRGLNTEFYHQTVTTDQIENYISESLNHNLDSFFDQYLRDSRIPVFEYRILKGNQLKFRWTNCNRNFDMPIKVKVNGEEIWLKSNVSELLTTKVFEEDIQDLVFDPNFYIYLSNATVN